MVSVETTDDRKLSVHQRQIVSYHMKTDYQHFKHKFPDKVFLFFQILKVLLKIMFIFGIYNLLTLNSMLRKIWYVQD